MTTVINGSSPSITFSDSTTQTTAFTTTPVINTINSQSTIPLTLGINGTEAMRIDSSGNVGIGTSSPTTLLQLGGATNKSMRIDSATGNAAFLGTFQTLSTFSANRNPSTGAFADTGKASAFISLDANVSNGQIVFATTASNNTEATERMRIDSSGNLFVSCTALPTGGVGGISLSSPATSNGMLLGTTGTGATNMIRFYNTNGNVGAITTSGSSTTYAASSDYRLKENLTSLKNSKEFILSLKPKQGNWKVDGFKFVGFVAHEFAETSPTSVIGEKDAVDAEGKPVYQSMQASSAEVMANLVALVQEQQALIENLTTRLNALEAK